MKGHDVYRPRDPRRFTPSLDLLPVVVPVLTAVVLAAAMLLLFAHWTSSPKGVMGDSVRQCRLPGGPKAVAAWSDPVEGPATWKRA